MYSWVKATHTMLLIFSQDLFWLHCKDKTVIEKETSPGNDKLFFEKKEKQEIYTKGLVQINNESECVCYT